MDLKLSTTNFLLYRLKLLSKRTLNICIKNNLDNLESIINFYNLYATFEHIYKCGRRANEELINISQNYNYLQNPSVDIKEFTNSQTKSNRFIQNKFNIKTKELNNLGILNKRCLSVCEENNLKCLNDILKHFEVYNTFDNIQNCGKKTNEDLISICLDFENKVNNILNYKKEDFFISKLNRTQRNIINNFIELKFNNLEFRSKNALSNYLNNNIKVRNIGEKILYDEKFDLNKIKNVGKKSFIDIEYFIKITKDFINKVSKIYDENKLRILRNRYLIEKSFSISKIPDDIIENLSIFKLVDFLLRNNLVLEKNSSIVLKKTFKIFKNEEIQSLSSLADELKLTKERIRQIRSKIHKELVKHFRFIKLIDDDFYEIYNIDKYQNLVFVDDFLSRSINKKENTNFTKEFISFLIYSYDFDKFTLIGKLEYVFKLRNTRLGNHHKWKNFYLIKKDIASNFDFESFVSGLNKKIIEKNKESYSLNFKSYISNFMLKNEQDDLNVFFPIAEKILNLEFNKHLDLYENIVFETKRIKQTYEYSYEALKELGKPTKVSEITSKILELHPDYETDDAKVRASMKRKNGFVPIGRKSIFGLKAWESELENFKGGTIRSITLEYLDSHLKPQHISTIASYVLKFRPKSNEKSILHNLKLDESGSFLFFKNSYVGLSSKNYDKSYILVSDENMVDKKTWDERYLDLSKFLNQNDRLPFSIGCPENEIKLYRWYKVQLGKYRKGNLDSEKFKLIKDVFDKYEKNSARKRRTNVTDKYNELIIFVMEQKRLPSANKEGEKNLYQFFYKQRKFYDKGELRPDEEHNFIKVAKIIQTYKYENKGN